MTANEPTEASEDGTKLVADSPHLAEEDSMIQFKGIAVEANEDGTIPGRDSSLPPEAGGQYFEDIPAE